MPQQATIPLSQGFWLPSPYVTHVVQSCLSSTIQRMGHPRDLSWMIFCCLQYLNKNITCKLCPFLPTRIPILSKGMQPWRTGMMQMIELSDSSQHHWISFVCFKTRLCSSGWSGMLYIVEDEAEFLILLSLSPECLSTIPALCSARLQTQGCLHEWQGLWQLSYIPCPITGNFLFRYLCG